MIIKKYISVISTAAALVAALQASSASAVLPCDPGIPGTSGGTTGNVTCGTAPGPNATGRASYNTTGFILFYEINLNVGQSSQGLPTTSTGAQVPKVNGGFCPGITDASPGTSKVTADPACTLVTKFAAKKYHITVG